MSDAKWLVATFHLPICPSSRRLGLTLIELVLVIGIIALLIGIVWAVLSPIREKGRQAVCMSNLKQIHLALMMYRENWHGTHPAEGVLPHQLGLPVVPDYHLALLPYIKSKDVFVCPNDYEYHKTGILSYVWHFPPYPYEGNWVIETSFALFKQKVKHCGDRFVLLDCRWHGWNQGTDFYVITVRWNGQVKGHYVRIPIDIMDNPCWDPP